MFSSDLEFFQLVAGGAFYHDDLKEKTFLRAYLDKWLQKQEGIVDPGIIRNIITKEQGTALEPFVLSEADVECAVFLAQLAFSKNFNSKRFTIVSRDTIGEEGGLVITNNLKSYYSERFLFGKNRHIQKSGFKFIPNNLKYISKYKLFSEEVFIISEESGFLIVIPNVIHQSEWVPDIARAFQNDGRIEGTKDSFINLGLRVDAVGRDIHIQTGSPESIIKIMPLLMEEKLIHLQVSESEDVEQPWFDYLPKILIRLKMPEEDKVLLPSIYSNIANNYKWAQSDSFNTFKVTKKVIQSVGSWCRPHSYWVSKFVELI